MAPNAGDNLVLSTQHSQKQRWWTKRNSFTRSVGFELPFILGFGRNVGEEPKVIIKTSRKLALARCSIHIIPILVSTTVLVLNLGNSYLGRGLPGSIIDPSINIALLQVAAKAQELLIIASVTTVVIHVLRSEMVTGEGLPLGLVGGGFLYSSMSYFWSPEFWGSFHMQSSKCAKFRVFGIIILGGLIASFAGPSTAILLIPRDQPWPAGGTVTYMPGPAEEWWSTNPSTKGISLSDTCRSSSAIDNSSCPGGGYPALWNARTSIDILGAKTYVDSSPDNLTTGFSFGPRTLGLQTDLDIVPDIRYHGNYRGYACETSLSGPRLANAVYQAQLKRDWIQEVFAIPYNILSYGPSLSQYKYFGSMQVTTDTQIPAVRTTCSSAQLLQYPETTVMFPVLPEDSCWSTIGELLVTNMTDLKQAPANITRATWVQLPAEFGAVSGGIIVELPTMDRHSRALIGCSFDARWTPGKVITYHLEQASSLEKVAAQIVATTALFAQSVPASQWSPGYSEFRPVTASASSSRVELDRSWLDALTPIIEELSNSSQNVTTLENIIANVGLIHGLKGSPQEQFTQWNTDTAGRVNRTVALEWWLSLIIADGLSREGSSKIIGGVDAMGDLSLLNYEKVADFRNQLFSDKIALARPKTAAVVEERTRISIGGYAYRATSITDYASAVLLLTHILMALIHTFYASWTRRSSNSWDSLTELLVLMQNSRPALSVLHNTNAGIHDLGTYSKRARILAVREHVDSQQRALDSYSRAELVFDEGGVENGEYSHVVNQQRQSGCRMFRNKNSGSLISIASDSDNAIAMEDMQEVPNASSLRTSMHESWTFPVDIRSKRLNHRIYFHSQSDSQDQLIPRRSVQMEAHDTVQVDRCYG